MVSVVGPMTSAVPANDAESDEVTLAARKTALAAAVSREVEQSIHVDGYDILDAARVGHELWTPYLDRAQRDGVTDEDLLWWWGLPLSKRIELWKVFDALHAGVFLASRHAGATPEEADALSRRVNVAYCMHADYEDEVERGVPEQDRGLPVELNKRVERWARGQLFHRRRMREQAASYVTRNAWVRDEIEAGNI
jgi:hypothetical protein